MNTNRKRMWLILSLFAIAAVLFAGVGAVRAAGVIYVRPDGDDVNCDGTLDAAYPGSGGPGLNCAVKTIQKGIDLVDPGGTINVAAGNYIENLVLPKSLVLAGAGMGSTVIYPAVSNPNPCTDSSLCGSSITSASNVIGVQASDVTIQDLTVDGDNPGLTSGIVRGGADLDARNGIITDHSLGLPFNNLVVQRVEVKNIYLRGIYASTNASFNFHHNTVSNVQGDGYSIGMFAWYGPGTMANNTVSYTNDAISANHSKGIQFLNNTVTHSGSGVHTDNSGDGGGVADLIQGNIVSDCAAGGYGVWVFVPFLPPTIDGNTITNCSVGLSAWGQGAAVNSLFTNNVVDGQGLADSVGVYITTDTISWGYSDVSVTFNNNVIKNNAAGIQFIANQQTWNTYPFVAKTITSTFFNNDISANTTPVYKDTQGFYSLNASGNWWGTNVPANVKAAVNAGVGIDYTPWLNNGTDTADPGFQGDFSNLWVDDDSPQTGSTGRINEALGMVSGSTINVAAGLYDERLVLTAPVTLKGATQGISKKGYVVPGGYAYDTAVESVIRPSTALEAPVINIKSDNVVIDGFVVAYEVAQTGGVYQDLIELDQHTSVTTGLQIINNVLGPNTNSAAQDGTKGRSGFTVIGPRAVPLKNLQIKDNKIFDSKGNGCGIMIVATFSPEYYGGGGTGYLDMSGGAIENNEITGNHRSGIELAGGVSGEAPGGFVIKNNLITNNGFGGTGDAANLKYGHGVTLIRGGGDKAKSNPSGSRYLLFEGNTFSGNEKSGLYFGSQNHDIDLEQNNIVNNGLGGGGYNQWDGVRFDLDEAYYTGHTIRYDILANINIHNSNITGNGGFGIKVIQTPTQGPVNAELNWWGCPCGPGTTGADSVSANVDYTPWWTNPAMTIQGPGPGGELIVPTGATTAEAQAILDCAAGKTVVFEGGTYPGGLVVNGNATTIKLNGVTVGHGTPAFTINADDVSVLGPGILNGSGSSDPAILVNGGADNFMLQNVQVTGWANAVKVAGSVDSFKMISNWIHSNSSHGLLVDSGAAIGGVVTIQGNLFKVNGGNGVQNDGSTANLKAEYNSWGSVSGPASPAGDGIGGSVDADPFTFAEVYLDMDPATAGDQFQRSVYETQTFNVSLNVEAANLYGVSFTFAYDPAILTPVGSPAFEAPWAGKCVVPPISLPAGTISYVCNLTGGSAWNGGKLVTFSFTAGAGVTPQNGPWQTLFNVSPAEADTSAGAVGGVKVFVNNAGFNAPSSVDRDITDANDGQIDITGVARFKGYIDLQGRGNDSGAVIKVYDDPNGTLVFAQGSSASSGAFLTAYQGSSVLQVGTTYYFSVDRDLFLPTAFAAGPWNPNKVLTTRPDTSLSTLLLLGGDATNDNLIDPLDAACIGSAYGGTLNTCSGTGASSDVNGDGIVNLYDLVLMGGNYFLTYSTWVP